MAHLVEGLRRIIVMSIDIRSFEKRFAVQPIRKANKLKKFKKGSREEDMTGARKKKRAARFEA